MLMRGHEEKDQRGPTSSVLNVSRSLAERAAAKVPMSLGSSGSEAFGSSMGSGSCGSGGRITANISGFHDRRKRRNSRTNHQELTHA